MSTSPREGISCLWIKTAFFHEQTASWPQLVDIQREGDPEWSRVPGPFLGICFLSGPPLPLSLIIRITSSTWKSKKWSGNSLSEWWKYWWPQTGRVMSRIQFLWLFTVQLMGCRFPTTWKTGHFHLEPDSNNSRYHLLSACLRAGSI